jgi:SAM-dependent methyltransferase
MSTDERTEELRILQLLRDADELWTAVRSTVGSEFFRQSRLRAQFPDELVRAALQLEDVRARARGKFSRADAMWFDRVGLEQSTSEAVARHKAGRFSGRVFDLCCGIGGDTLALAARGDVVSIDLNPVQLWRTQQNAAAYEVGAGIETRAANVEEVDVGRDLVHIDPDRRPHGKSRSTRIEDSIPSHPFLEGLMQRASGGAIKLSPASNFLGKFPDAEIELISLHGECKEATVWFGSLGEPGAFRATVLPHGDSLAGRPLDWISLRGPVGRYLYDPDPAVVRAGLVDMLAEQVGLRRLDDAEEYLASDNLVATPFAQPFEVIVDLPNNAREIRAAFRGSSFGQVEIKCRHIPIRADELRKTLPLPGSEPGTLVFARVAGKARALLCRRLTIA